MAGSRLIRELHGKYRILAQLGEGGSALVWLAVAQGPSGFNKLVVLKTIRSELVDQPDIVEMFLDEARLAARINHPNVVQTNEVFEKGNHPIIVMEYLDGVPFSAVLERQRAGHAMALAMLLRIVSEALVGLHAAHELTDYDGTNLEVVHRDISPHNLFITFAGQVKVLDFGVAQLGAVVEGTHKEEIRGKLRYMAPEQIEAQGTDRRADIYSVGVILWEVATSRRMFAAGIPEREIRASIILGDLPRIFDLDQKVEPELIRIIEKALSVDPGRRHQTALELQTDLDEYITSLGGLIRNRDVGRALSKMFADVREERATTIEAQMKSPSAFKRGNRGAALPELTPFSRTQRDARTGPRRANTPWALLVAFFLSLVAFVAALLWPPSSSKELAHEEKKTELPSSPKSSTGPQEKKAIASPPPQMARKSLTLRITAFPKAARMTLDGNELLGNPYSAEFQQDELDHQLVVQAPGYEKRTEGLRFERNLNLTIALSPKNRKPASRPVRPTASDMAPKPSDKAPKKDCAPPYYFDDRGIKKYRPECM